MIPSGEQYRIESHGYAADVVAVGGALRTLSSDGRPLVRAWAAESLMPVYAGAVLAPWPNRIGDGRYTFDGVEYEVPVNELDRQNSLHGLVAWVEWDLAERTESSVSLRHRMFPTLGYPWRLDFTVTYALDADGLTWTLTTRNVGDSAAPYGASVHPYFVPLAPGLVDDWTLTLRAASYLAVDPERLLPLSVEKVAGTVLDFAEGKAVGDVFLDHAYTDIDFGADGLAALTLLGPDGHGVAVSWDSASPWVQLHTGDRPEVELNRTGLAVEPMTCPPDAFRTGQDLVVLQPGEEHSATWRVTAV